MDVDDVLFPEDEGLPEARQEAKSSAEEALYQHYREVFTGRGSVVSAKEVMRDLHRQGWGMQSTYDPNPQTHAFREGARALLLHILRMAGADTRGVIR